MESSVRESELDKYVDRAYKQLEDGHYRTKYADGIFKCPFCMEKKHQEYLYDDLLQHAGDRGKGLKSMNLKQQGQHIALLSYLSRCYGPRVPSKPSREGDSHVGCGKDDNGASSSRVLQSSGKRKMLDWHDNDDIHLSKTPKYSGEKDAHFDQDKSKRFVFPWKGIIVNVPLELEDGKYIGESGSKLKEHLIEQGFNPLRVKHLWSPKGHSGCCIVDFVGDSSGFGDAMKFEKAFEVDHHGKKDWYKEKCHGDKLFGWVATEEDYQSKGLVGKHLQRCDLKSIDDIKAEENRKTRCLVSHLTSTIEAKYLQYKIMESKLQATSISMSLVMNETDAMVGVHNKEMSDMLRTQRDRMERMLVEHERIKKKIESQRKQLKLREKELAEREARNEDEKRELSRQQEMNELAHKLQKKADDNMLRLAEEQKREKEALHRKIIDLEKELDHKQALELEIERMRGAMQVMKHMGDDEDIEVKKKMESIAEELKDKEEELEATEELKQALIVKEHKASEELQEARKELINGLQSASTRGVRPFIGVKILGELDGRLFVIGAKRKYPDDVASEKATELWSLWEAYMKDSSWHPFKHVSDNGTDKEVINEEDERLKELMNELGEEVYKAVVTALIELNEYNPQDRNPQPELWNFKEERRAKLWEGLDFLVNQWKRKRKTR